MKDVQEENQSEEEIKRKRDCFLIQPSGLFYLIIIFWLCECVRACMRVCVCACKFVSAFHVTDAGRAEKNPRLLTA